MPYRISWLVEGRVILAELSGDLTAEELIPYDRAICQHLDAAKAFQVHYLVDTSRVQGLPGMNDMKDFSFLRHPRMGWTAAVGIQSPLVRSVGNFLSKLYKIKARELKSVDEALEFLQSVDPTLPDLRPAVIHHLAKRYAGERVTRRLTG
jgi:hypothetical protein